MSTIRLKSHRAIALTAWLYCWLMGCSVDPAPESAVDHVEVDWGNVFGTLQTVWIHDDHEAWVAGEGVIWGSTDGGETWRVLWSDDEQRVYSLYGSITGDDLWAVGRAGLMLRSDNCGEDWVIQRFVTSEDLTSITGTADGSTLWAVGTSGTFLKSIDAGESWSVDEIGNSATLLSVAVTSDGSRLWAVGQYGMIWHSADAGETWDQQAGFLPMSFPGSDGGDTLNSVFVGVDGARVWAVGASGTILTSTDQGANWVDVHDRRGPQFAWLNRHFYSVYENHEGSHVWVVGGTGDILLSTNDGEEWEEATLEVDDRWLFDVRGVGSGGKLLAVGESRLVLKSTDAGRSWSQKSGTPQGDFNAIHGDGTASQLWVAGTNGVILHSPDRGQTWFGQRSGTQMNINAVYGTETSSHLWAVGEGGLILHSTDLGENWEQASVTSSDLWGVYGNADGSEVYAVGTGVLLRSTDFGVTWSNLRDPQSRREMAGAFRDVFVSDDGARVVAVGFEGEVVYSGDHGATWHVAQERNESGTRWEEGFHLTSIHGSSSGSTLWAGGEQNGAVVLRSTNGGKGWRVERVRADASISAVSGSNDGGSVWAVGRFSGPFLHSLNGGDWHEDRANPHSLVLDVFRVTTGYMYGR